MASSCAADCWEAPQAQQIPLSVEAASKTYLISSTFWPKSLISQENVDHLCYSSNAAAFRSFFWAPSPLAVCCSWPSSGNLPAVTRVVGVHDCNWNLCYWRRSDVRLAEREGLNLGRIPVLMRGETPEGCLITADQVILMVKIFILCCNNEMSCCVDMHWSSYSVPLLARILSLLTLLSL